MPDPSIANTTRLITPQASEGALERARLRAEWFARQAGVMPDVREFRRSLLAPEHLRGGAGPASEHPGDAQRHADVVTVAPETARAVLASPAVAVLSVKEFADAGIPILGHTSDVLEMRLSSNDEDVQFVLQLECPGRESVLHTCSYPVWTPALRDVTRPELVLPPRPGSVRDELDQLGDRLSQRFPWDAQAAAWCVLTGEAPVRPPLEIALHLTESSQPPYTDAQMTLTLDATLSPDELARHYTEVRDQLLGGIGIRRAELRTLQIFQFVTARRLEDPDRTWSELVREWDETAPPVWRFDGNAKNFRIYWRRGLRSIFPEFHLDQEHATHEEEHA